MTQIINHTLFTPDGSLSIPDETTADQWKRIHADIMVCCRASKKWLKQSREFGSEKFGLEFAAEWEAQMEMNLGDTKGDAPKLELNPADKSRVFVSIEGINQQFNMWWRKMEDEIPTWDKDKLERAYDLLRPIEEQARQIRKMIDGVAN